MQGMQGTSNQGVQGAVASQGAQSTQGTQGLSNQGVQGTQGLQGTAPVIGGSANQIVYKDPSNVSAGNANFLFLNNSTFIVGAATSTGTTSQPVQITGGTYVSGNLGIGVTNPTSNLDVNGTISATDTITLTTKPFFRNVPTIASNYTVTTTYNEMSVGPITINSGVTVTVNSGATWTVI